MVVSSSGVPTNVTPGYNVITTDTVDGAMGETSSTEPNERNVAGMINIDPETNKVTEVNV